MQKGNINRKRYLLSINSGKEAYTIFWHLFNTDNI